MGNGMNKILPGLYIGNFKDARDAEQLSKNKVTHILSVHDSARPMLEGVKYLCIPAADSPSQNLTRHFKESIKFIHECRLRGEGCLVHCLAGVSRSVTLVIAYIMTVTDFGWEDALHTVRAGRSCANPNLGFQRQLQEFEKHEVHQYRQWLKEEYGESPLRDAEEAKNILVHFCWVPWNTDFPHGGQEREGGEGGSRLLLHEPTQAPSLSQLLPCLSLGSLLDCPVPTHVCTCVQPLQEF
ncbi:dual specificity protein phosphatase 22 isoform X3 [Panthera tigris]|uniref:dual specificity protein phosphatase 22 isoform X3 n=1 Tax=Panthera tigris TaxID=9694 RepID=UPI001C6F77F6|nr:dual specificity protein phosphatase 22 isoform X3 [Panthera tigris]